jgi:voltage-gated potassium channel
VVPLTLPRIRRGWLRIVLPLAVVVAVLGGGGLAAVETETIGGYGDGLLWALSLMTTVGFINGHPHTAAGKLIAAALMVSGFGLLTMTTAAISSLFVRDDIAPGEQLEQAYEVDMLRELQALHARLDELETRRR